MKRIFILFLALCLLLTGCGGTKKTTDTVFAMDTVMTLTVYGKTGATADLVLSECRKELYRLEDMLSVTDPDSQVARLNAGDSDALSSESRELLRSALTGAARTGGTFDPTLYALTDLWGFYDDAYSVPSEAELQAVRSCMGYEKLDIVNGEVTMPAGMGIDFGGIAKGYAAQKVLQIINSYIYADQAEAAVISLGGNVGLLGTKPDGSDWTVAVEKPDGSGDAMAVMHIPGGAYTYVVTSGAYQRYFEQDGKTYHHILDRETGLPAKTNLQSVTIVAEDGPLADAFSTALFVMGLEEAIAFWQSYVPEVDGDFDMVLFDGETLYITPNITIETQLPVREVTR